MRLPLWLWWWWCCFWLASRNSSTISFYCEAATTTTAKAAAFAAGPLVSDASLDRFVAKCPADEAWIRQYDASLLHDNNYDFFPEQNGIWAAVYRSNQNMPSVVLMARDQFWNAMNSATTNQNNNGNEHDDDNHKNNNNNMRMMNGPQGDQDNFFVANKASLSSSLSSSSSSLAASSPPVAVARLRPSLDFENTWILDSMRCVLKKEDTNIECDGGSEHAEAIAVAIDTLLCHHLRTNNNNNFIGFSIRSKATLVSAKLLEERGFVPVTALTRDMCSHVSSSVEECLARYADRAVNLSQHSHHRLSPTARDNAMQMVALLGQLQSTTAEQQQAAAAADHPHHTRAEDDEDYWSHLGKFSL